MKLNEDEKTVTPEGILVSKFHQKDFELLRENRIDVVERSCEGMGLDDKHV